VEKLVFENWLNAQPRETGEPGGEQTSIVAEAGSFQLTPVPSTLAAGSAIVAEAGLFTLVGEPAAVASVSGVQPKRRGRRKRALAEKVVNKIWQGPPPEHVTDKSIIDQVGARLKKDYHVPDEDIKPDTILRAAGRRID
jgi:hypothetical protein